MRFVADAMLGTCAKWLRILGYDTSFDPELDDHQLVRLARAEGRVLLTRDRDLARRRGVRVLLIASERLEEQVAQVLLDLELEPDAAFSRCPVCNEPLEAVDLDTVTGLRGPDPKVVQALLGLPASVLAWYALAADG
jgi:uncharacterized protein